MLLNVTSTHLLDPCRGGDLPCVLCYLRCTIAVLLEAVCASGCVFGFWCWLPAQALVLSARSSHLVSITPSPSHGWSLSEVRKATLLLERGRVRCLFQAGDDVLCLCAAALMFPLDNLI